MDNKECTIQRHMQHWVQDTDRRQTKQNTQHRYLKKISNTDDT